MQLEAKLLPQELAAVMSTSGLGDFSLEQARRWTLQQWLSQLFPVSCIWCSLWAVLHINARTCRCPCACTSIELSCSVAAAAALRLKACDAKVQVLILLQICT